MFFRSHVPPYPLSRFIEHTWFHADYNPPYQKERLLPEGVIELIIDMQDDPKILYAGGSHVEQREFSGAWISGQRQRPIVIQAGPSTMMGVRFKPGGAWPFLELPVCELTGQVVPMELLWGQRINDLRTQLLEADDLDSRFRVLDVFLLAWMNRVESIDPFVDSAIQRIRANPADIAIRDLVDQSGYSHRHFISTFKQKVGLTPKSLARIFRFQQAIALIERSPNGASIDWSRVIYPCGYYDQSHFIHEFRSLTGHTPTSYLKSKSPYLNYLIEAD